MRLLDDHSRHDTVFRRDEKSGVKGDVGIVHHLSDGGLKPRVKARSSGYMTLFD